jgi:AraC family transcriptional regulator
MLKPYDLLENILLDIEDGIKNNINAAIFSKKYAFSEGHLRRLFSFAFNISIASYIRSRTLAATLNDLLETDNSIVDIAIEYGFEYEQSYIRAFKREFGITPGHLRKTRQVIQIKPPLHLFDERRLDNGILFGPDFVMVPRFHVVGKRHRLSFKDMRTEPLLTKQFWENERKQIKETVNPHACINFTCNINLEERCFDYIPSLQVADLKNIPPGLCGETFETSMCVRFRYIGQHHYYEINGDVVSMMTNAIGNFAQDEHIKYVLINDKSNFIKIDSRLYDGTYCQMEWYTPVYEKQERKI